MAKSPFFPRNMRELNKQDRDPEMCDWCGVVTRLQWRAGAGYCRSCHRELLRDEEAE